MLAGQAVMINWSNVAAEDRPAYYAWHNREHMPGAVRVEGFLRGRRYLAARARRDILVFYEIAELSVLTGEEYTTKVNNPSALTRQTTKVIKDSIWGLTRVKCSLGSGIGGYALTLRFDPPEGREDEFGRYLSQEALPRIADRIDIIGAHLLATDKPMSSVVTVERRGRPTEVPNWIVVIEGISLDAVETACDAQLAEETLRRHGCVGDIARDTYSLQLVLPKA